MNRLVFKEDAQTQQLTSFAQKEILPRQVIYDAASFMEVLVETEEQLQDSKFELHVEYQGNNAHFKKAFPLEVEGKNTLISKGTVFVRDVLPEEEQWPGSLKLGLMRNNNLICTSHAINLVFGE